MRNARMVLFGVFVVSITAIFCGRSFGEEEYYGYKGRPAYSVPVASARSGGSFQVIYGYVPVPKEETIGDIADLKDIGRDFIGMGQNAGVIEARATEDEVAGHLVELYIRAGDLGSAEETMKNIREPGPRQAAAGDLVRAFLDRQDTQGAERTIKEHLSTTSPVRDPKYFFINEILLELRARGMYDTAGRMPLDKGLMSDPDNDCIQILCLAARSAISGDRKKAALDLGKASDLAENAERVRTPIYIDIAETYYWAGDLSEAERYFREAFASSRKDMFFEMIAVRASAMGYFDMVREEGNKVWDFITGSDRKMVSDAFTGIAEYRLACGDRPGAVESAVVSEANTRSIKDAKERASALARLAKFYLSAKDEDSALRVFNEFDAVFRGLTMRGFADISTNLSFLDAMFKRVGKIADGKTQAELLGYAMAKYDELGVESRRYAERASASLAGLAKRAFDLGAHDILFKALNDDIDIGYRTDLVRYAAGKDPAFAGTLADIVGTWDMEGLSVLDEADVRIAAAKCLAIQKETRKAEEELSAALSMLDESPTRDTRDIKRKYELTVEGALVNDDLENRDTCMIIMRDVMKAVAAEKSPEVKKAAANDVKNAFVRIFGLMSEDPPRRYREYSRLYW